jgi:Fe-S-cluster containining protein
VLDADPTPRELTEMRGDRRWMKPHATKPWCVALDLATRSCTVYENRPSICRHFERGSLSCSIAITKRP